MNILIKISLLLFCCLALAQCKKEEETNCNTLTEGVDPFLVSNFKFLPGTIWNYVNEISNDTSLISVSSTETNKEYLYISKGGSGVPPCYHTILFMKIALSVGQSYSLTEDKITNYIPGGYGSITLNQLENSSFGGTFMDTLFLPTGNFFSVYKSFTSSISLDSYYDSTCYYFNQDYGIVRKELYLGHGQYEIWNLSSATIVR